jgi:hypothetical protein
MRKILAALLCCWCSHALAQTAQELIDNPKNSENVTTFGMGYHLNQYSPLNQINKSNVKRLVPIWTTSLSNDAGEMTQPSIYNGIMYVVNGNWMLPPANRSGARLLSMSARRRGSGLPAPSCAGAPRFTMAGCFASRLIVTSSRST